MTDTHKHRRSSSTTYVPQSPVPEFLQRWSNGSGKKENSEHDPGVRDQDQYQWPLPNSRISFPGTAIGDPITSLKQDLGRLVTAHQRWLVEVCQDQNKNFTPEELDSVEFLDDIATFQGVPVKAIARSSGKDSPYVDKWEARFRQYSLLKRDLAELEEASLSERRSSAPRSRRVILKTISPYGDAILEFANTDNESILDEQPILRFRVSSYMLTECSPIFARMFSQHPKLLDTTLDLDQDIPREGPVPFSDSIQLWRMPQIETNKESSLTILLHAAHMHNDQVPRTIRYEQLVALSEAAIRYRCSKPLELFFEHCWLHQWIRKANDEMPDGLVTISYAFGRRRLFSRVTKSVILHLTDEEELRAKDWPQVVKDKIWAVRSAKMAQVYATCSETIEEYLRRPRASEAIPVIDSTTSGTSDQSARGVSGIFPDLFTFSSVPRCPKGSHWCDATNLGWLLLIYNELRLFSAILGPSALTGLSLSSNQNTNTAPPRSLAKVLDALRGMANPPHPVHSAPAGVCDPVPAFRDAINDIYNSVTGLALQEVDGATLGQRVGETSVRTLGTTQCVSSSATKAVTPSTPRPNEGASARAFREEHICLNILRYLDTSDDLRTVAMLNHRTYNIYKTHENMLMKDVV
ncbi:hypothetical protein V8F20_004652, partial [Naviculisporaceae sp. PSN 640]